MPKQKPKARKTRTRHDPPRGNGPGRLRPPGEQ